MTDKTRRRDLMRPVQLIAIAVVAAAFAFIITGMSMGAFQAVPEADKLRAWAVAGIMAGVAFIVVLLVVSLLLLAIDPAELDKGANGPVLMDGDAGADAAGGTADGEPEPGAGR